MPITELTMEQEFKLRRLDDLLPKADKKDIIILFMALQKQCYVLGNNVSQLVKEWPLPTHLTTTPTPGKSETLSEKKV